MKFKRANFLLLTLVLLLGLGCKNSDNTGDLEIIPSIALRFDEITSTSVRVRIETNATETLIPGNYGAYLSKEPNVAPENSIKIMSSDDNSLLATGNAFTGNFELPSSVDNQNIFIINIAGLSPKTTYYLKGFFKNSSNGPVAINPRDTTFSTLDILKRPKTTVEYPTVTANNVQIKGNVASDGGSPIVERGIIYGKVSPIDFKKSNNEIIVPNKGTLGDFTVDIKALPPGTYYYKAYAINEASTTSLSCCEQIFIIPASSGSGN